MMFPFCMTCFIVSGEMPRSTIRLKTCPENEKFKAPPYFDTQQCCVLGDRVSYPYYIAIYVAVKNRNTAGKHPGLVIGMPHCRRPGSDWQAHPSSRFLTSLVIRDTPPGLWFQSNCTSLPATGFPAAPPSKPSARRQGIRSSQ